MRKYVYSWKVIGLRGLTVISTYILADSEKRARFLAREDYGMWAVLRITRQAVVA